MKGRLLLETSLCKFFYPVQNLHFVMSSESQSSSVNGQKSAPFETSWHVLVYFCVLKSSEFLKVGSKNEQQRSKR